jgi:hypothetical protein
VITAGVETYTLIFLIYAGGFLHAKAAMRLADVANTSRDDSGN